MAASTSYSSDDATALEADEDSASVSGIVILQVRDVVL